MLLEFRRQIWSLITSLKQAGRAILLTSHHLEEAEKLGTRIGIIHKGRIAAEGTMDELRALVHAEELAVVESVNPDAVRDRAKDLGLAFRGNYGTTVLWLRERTDIRSVVDALGDVPLTSVRLKPVGLEEVFSEIVGETSVV